MPQTLTDKIVEAVKAAAHARNFITGIAIDEQSMRWAIENALKDSLVQIDKLVKLASVELLTDDYLSQIKLNKDGKKHAELIRGRIGYTLADLPNPPKTEADGK